MMMNPENRRRYTVGVLVSNEPGVLSRVSGLFSRRGFNIESLAVGPTQDSEVSRITIVVLGDDAHIEQLVQQLYKLICVQKVQVLSNRNDVERQLLLVKVAADVKEREGLMRLVDIFKAKVLDAADFDIEVIFVDDGSGDNSYQVMRELARKDARIRIFHLSRNFGSDAATLCGLVNATGDCAVVKAADLQEPSEMLLDMYRSWQSGNNVVLAVREGREESRSQEFFADLYYAMTRKFALPGMPKKGFDVFLLDRRVIEVLKRMDEPNSALTGQILWSGFKTGVVTYIRRERKIGKSRWTLKKKIRLVADTLFSFSTLPITIVTGLGFLSVVGSLIWAIDALVSKLTGHIDVTGWTMMFIFQLLSFGVVMMTLGLLGAYLWRTFDASRRRPPYLVEIADGQKDDGEQEGRV